MSVKNVSSTNDSHHSQLSSSNFSSLFPCTDSFVGGYTYSACMIINITLVLPLSLFVLYLGFQRWIQERRVTSAAVVSLSDFITYNLAVMELMGVSGSIMNMWGITSSHFDVMWVGVFMGILPWSGQMVFPILTCLERYLAAVHPITYLRLRQVGGVRIRNISTAYVWLHCSVDLVLVFMSSEYSNCILILHACEMGFYVIVMTFCSLSVLRVLNRPRPGEAGGDRARVDQSKQRAFHTIMGIMGVLLVRFGGNLVCRVLGSSPTVSYSVQCVAKASTGLFNLPSSLVLPLLFLHRAGKLPCCKHNTESG